MQLLCDTEPLTLGGEEASCFYGVAGASRLVNGRQDGGEGTGDECRSLTGRSLCVTVAMQGGEQTTSLK